jgi:hypothetical protein
VGVNILLVVCHTAQLMFVARSRGGGGGGGGGGDGEVGSGVRGRDPTTTNPLPTIVGRGLMVVALMCGCGGGFIAHRYWLAQGQVPFFKKKTTLVKKIHFWWNIR